MADDNGSNNIVAIFAIIVIVLIAAFILYYAFGNREPASVVPTSPNSTIIEAPATPTPAPEPVAPATGDVVPPNNNTDTTGVTP